MRKLLRPGDVLLLGLAGALDVFEEIRDPFGIMAYGCKTMYGWVPERYKRHNFARVVKRQLKTGNIEKKIKDGEAYFGLTSAGQEKIRRDFPLIVFQKQKWDGKWRIVAYDIAEITRKARNALRNKLKELGFGKLQQSVWITPHDIFLDFNEFIQEKNLEEQVYLTETTRFLTGDERGLANKIWHLDELNEEYQNILNDLNELRDMYVTSDGRRKQHTYVQDKTLEISKKTGEKKEENIKVLKIRYLNLLLKDPFLPKELLPENWVGEEVRKEISRLNFKIITTRQLFPSDTHVIHVC